MLTNEKNVSTTVSAEELIEKAGPLLTCLQNALQGSHDWQGIFNALVDLVDEPLCLSLADNYAGEDETAGSAEDQKCVALVGEMTNALLLALDFLNKEHNSNAAFFSASFLDDMVWNGWLARKWPRGFCKPDSPSPRATIRCPLAGMG